MPVSTPLLQRVGRPSRALALASMVALATSCQSYPWRMITLRQIDVDDYTKLPATRIAPSPAARPLPEAPDRTWITRVPLRTASGTIDRESALDAFLASHGTTAFIILAHGRVVDERYYAGHARESLFKSFSISKSVLSALVGIAQAEGALRITDSLGAHLDLAGNAPLARVTLEQLADNVSGLRYRRGILPWKEQPQMYYTSDARDYVRGAMVVRPAGTVFEAEELSPLLLGYALERALRRRDASMTIARYAEERLWRPMGARYDALWNTDRARDGLAKTESGFVARAIDLARFGQLYLDHGIADGRTIVPSAWVAASTTRPPSGAPNGEAYGFHRLLWWGQERAGATRPDFYANGHFGQRIYVSPDKSLVLVRLGKATANVNWTGLLTQIAAGWPAAP